jgi:hypothetical protein
VFENDCERRKRKEELKTKFLEKGLESEIVIRFRRETTRTVWIYKKKGKQEHREWHSN